MAKNVYIHIPFCKSKCHYCSFTSFVDLKLKDKYLIALKQQISIEYKGEKLNTLYFGGGTPSLLAIDEIQSLINLFDFEKDAEVTIEVNPDSVNYKYLPRLKKIGINRLSIGAQTFDDETLKLIGRRHDSEQIVQAVNFAKKAGFENISLDFIYGLPQVAELHADLNCESRVGLLTHKPEFATQHMQANNFLCDLKKAVDLNIQHISLYGLKIDKGCYFYKNPPNSMPDLDSQADMYLNAVEFLKSSGFEHYEISNFAKSGFESRHNLNYWDNNSYYGFGCAASGYIDNVRYINESDLEKYIQKPLSKCSEQKLSKQEILEEAIFLGFRKIAGINIEEINQKFGINFGSKYKNILDKYKDFFTKTSEGYSLTLEGILISNEILSEFIID